MGVFFLIFLFWNFSPLIIHVKLLFLPSLRGFSARREVQQSGKGGAAGSGLESRRLEDREPPPAALCVEGALGAATRAETLDFASHSSLEQTTD